MFLPPDQTIIQVGDFPSTSWVVVWTMGFNHNSLLRLCSELCGWTIVYCWGCGLNYVGEPQFTVGLWSELWGWTTVYCWGCCLNYGVEPHFTVGLFSEQVCRTPVYWGCVLNYVVGPQLWSELCLLSGCGLNYVVEPQFTEVVVWTMGFNHNSLLRLWSELWGLTTIVYWGCGLNYGV